MLPGIQMFLAQFQALKLRKEMLNATNIYLENSIYLFVIKRTESQYIDTSFQLFHSVG